jgi:hypothetical protein
LRAREIKIPFGLRCHVSINRIAFLSPSLVSAADDSLIPLLVFPLAINRESFGRERERERDSEAAGRAAIFRGSGTFRRFICRTVSLSGPAIGIAPGMHAFRMRLRLRKQARNNIESARDGKPSWSIHIRSRDSSEPHPASPKKRAFTARERIDSMTRRG